MAVFIGEQKNTFAARCALKINYAVVNFINPAIKQQYKQNFYNIAHSVGVDECELFVARTGVRGANDLVWAGKAANYAAKLCSFRKEGYASYITANVYNDMDECVKESPDNRHMWERRMWREKNLIVYRSNWMWLL